MKDNLLIRLNDGYSKSKKEDLVKAINQQPLKRIPHPPQSYLELKTLISGLDVDDKTRATSKYFNKNLEALDEILKYRKTLYEVRNHNWANCLVKNLEAKGDGVSPVEKINVYGKSSWMLIYDFDSKDGELIKLYIPLSRFWE